MASCMFWLLILFICEIVSHSLAQLPIVNPVDEYNANLRSATTGFALDLFRRLAAKPDASDNLFYSPLSVYTALGMLNAGAKENTAKELETGLRWSLLSGNTNNANGHQALKKLTEEIFKPLSKNNTLDIANKLWLQQYFCTAKCNDYIQTLQNTYNAELGQINFALDAEAARQEINKWVEKKTNNKIKDLMPEGSINGLTRFVLTNAIYFKSTWKYQFDARDTRNQRFDALTKDWAKTTNIPMMSIEKKFRTYRRDPTVELIDIPYTGDALSMVVAVPRDRRGIAQLIARLDDAMLRNWFKNLDAVLYPYETNLYLPKFKVESDIKLKEYLKDMGITDVFTPSVADLSGITGYKGPDVCICRCAQGIC